MKKYILLKVKKMNIYNLLWRLKNNLKNLPEQIKVKLLLNILYSS